MQSAEEKFQVTVNRELNAKQAESDEMLVKKTREWQAERQVIKLKQVR